MPRHLSVYSPRAKLGLMVPPTNTVNEAEWSALVPPGVTFHTHRSPGHAGTPGDHAAMVANLTPSFALLGKARVDVIAYACTADSMVIPAELLPQKLTLALGVKVVTTAAALIAALKAFGASRLSVATPYAPPLNTRQSQFLAGHGFTVDRLVGLGIGASGPADYVRIAETPLDQIRSLVRSAFVPGSDAIVISCTDFPTLTLIEDLEDEFGVPVITSNSATFWASLRAAGIPDPIEGYGRLLAEH